MNATDILRKQHEDVRDLFERLRSTAVGGEKASLRGELASVLVAHDEIEKQLFYPACIEGIAPADDFLEAVEDHALQEIALARLLAVPVDDATFDAKVRQLESALVRHMAEEENSLLPQAESVLGEAHLELLGEQMEAMFERSRRHDYAPVLSALVAAEIRAMGMTPSAAHRAPARRAAAKKAKAAPARRRTQPAKARRGAKAAPAKKAASRGRAGARAGGRRGGRRASKA